MIPAYVNSAILLVISGLHVYWAMGGNGGLRVSVPEQNGGRAFQPGRVATLVVALLFGAMALFFLYKIGHLSGLDPFVPKWLSRYGLWVLAVVFGLRAIGDFRYVGFTKQVRSTRFAQLDTYLYSPLCLLMSLNTGLVIRQLTTTTLSGSTMFNLLP